MDDPVHFLLGKALTLGQTSTISPRRLRDLALLHLLANGLTVRQLHNLNLQDVDEKQGVVVVKDRKKKLHVVILEPASQVYISRWIVVGRLFSNNTEMENFTAGQTLGVRRLLERLNPREAYSLGELDSALRAGSLDISKDLPVWAQQANGTIEKRWGTAARRFSRVLVVGGGALLLKEALTRQFAGKAVVLDDPVLSIARGLYKLLLQKK
jgi:hypothetical protein